MSLDGLEKLRTMSNEEILRDIYRSKLSTLELLAWGAFAIGCLAATLVVAWLGST